MYTKEKALTVLKEVYVLCSELFAHKICLTYLYGSYAREEQNAASDIDIFLTVELTQEQIRAHRQALASITSELSLKYDITVSVTVKNHEHFLQYAKVLPYYQNVLAEGILYKPHAD